MSRRFASAPLREIGAGPRHGAGIEAVMTRAADT
jgi:hypothetical protein